MNITTDSNSDEAFAKAATQHITRTNLGGRVEVSVGGYFYTVTIPDNYRALIEYRRGWGGLENMHINATPNQDRALRAQLARTGDNRA
ncbi:hypothetical protein [Sphaerisporangium album]|nr:hypothetical protein [Sphaerisporangium album]